MALTYFLINMQVRVPTSPVHCCWDESGMCDLRMGLLVQLFVMPYLERVCDRTDPPPKSLHGLPFSKVAWFFCRQGRSMFQCGDRCSIHIDFLILEDVRYARVHLET